MSVPKDLVEAIRRHHVIPFVGAGVSQSVRRGLFPGWRELLEGLAGELEEQFLPEAAAQVRKEIASENYLEAAEVALQQLGAFRFNKYLRKRFRPVRPHDADLSVVRALWDLRPPLVLTTNYDDVLAWGSEHAERLANDQVDELTLMHSEEGPDTPRVWHLHGTIHRLSTLILGGSDYERLYGAPPAAGGESRQDERVRQHAAYRDYAWAVSELDRRLASRQFLYVGFSFNDEYVMRQVKHILQATKGKTAPSYALMKKGEGNRAYLWSSYNIQLIEYEDHGEPLVELLERLRRAAFGDPPRPAPPPLPLSFSEAAVAFADEPFPSAPAPNRAVPRPGSLDDPFPPSGAPPPKAGARPSMSRAREPAPPPPSIHTTSPRASGPTGAYAVPTPAIARPSMPPPGPPPGPPGGTVGAMPPKTPSPAPATQPVSPLPHVSRQGLVDEYARILQRDRKLVLLAPKRGGARSLAREMAKRYGPRVTWLAPPNHPDTSETDYCCLLAGNDEVKDFEGLITHIRERAREHGGEHLLVLRYEWGPIEHLKKLGNYLRQLLEEPSETPFHVLVAGGIRSAWLIHHVDRFSAFKDAPRREVPDLAVDEVRQLLQVSGHDGARWAAELHEATGGHLGLLNEVLLEGGPFDADSVTWNLARSPVLREAVRDRLRGDDRDGRSGRRHARWVLGELLAGREVQPLEVLDHQSEYAEVRLYFDGLVRRDTSGRTVLRCEAVARLAREALARQDGMP